MYETKKYITPTIYIISIDYNDVVQTSCTKDCGEDACQDNDICITDS